MPVSVSKILQLALVAACITSPLIASAEKQQSGLSNKALQGLQLLKKSKPANQNAAPQAAQSNTVISGEELARIAKKIYQNETGGDINKLIYWNPNENFASLGIGHAIWFSEGVSSRFTESFPPMIHYIASQGYPVPNWLMQQLEYGSLWNSKSELDNSRNSDRTLELQNFLVKTAAYQVAFIFDRLERALPNMIASAAPNQQSIIQNRFATLKATPGGLYPLLDYVNFKGEGISQSERYNGQGWGLLQVLENMPSTPPGPQALQAFAQSADAMLTRRVQNAPAGKGEERWLTGWRNRLQTYLQ